MKKARTTKQSLMLSVLALLVCISMFVGSTFAWFTDSVSSVNNIIKSGNLDVEMEYYDGDSWEKVAADTNVFAQDTLWEPGHTEIVYLRLSNKGTLALKYQLGVNVANEVKSTNVYEKELKLSDHIKFGAVEGVSTPYGDDERDVAVAAVEADAITLATGYTKEGSIEANGDAQYVALVVYMPETVGNEANYKTGAAVPMIHLGINLAATQYTSEEDSFGKDYDAAAEYAEESLVPKETLTDVEVGIFDIFNTGSGNETKTFTFDAYTFSANNFKDEYPAETYGTWECDYYVTVDKALNEGLYLVGNYGDYGWLGFEAPHDGSVEPNVAVPLLGSVTQNPWTYQMVLDNVGTFICGLTDDGNNAGTTVTVELRLTNPTDSSDIKTVSKIVVTL